MIERIKNQIIAWVSGLFAHCHHYQYSERTVVLYCLTLAAIFVGALYVLVPSKVRQLDRDHPNQIQWRTLSSFVVSAGAIGTYPLFFCDLEGPLTFAISDVVFRPRHVQGVLAHTVILFLGPIVASLIRVHELRTRALARKKKQGAYVQEVFRRLLYPSFVSFLNPCTEDERWKNIRNFIVAPLTEEIVFRGCMVPALLASGMTPLRVSLVAPLFFGIAHIHHAVTKLSKGERMKPVLLMTVLQFAYTSMFGSYAASAFIRTGSVGAVTISHAYCNWMGLPDLSFMQIRHPMYKHRTILLSAYVVGALTFKWSFSNDRLLPLPAVLTGAIVASEKMES